MHVQRQHILYSILAYLLTLPQQSLAGLRHCTTLCAIIKISVPSHASCLPGYLVVLLDDNTDVAFKSALLLCLTGIHDGLSHAAICRDAPTFPSGATGLQLPE